MGFILTGATYTPNKLLKGVESLYNEQKIIYCTVNKYENSTLQSFGTANVVVICWCPSLVVFGKSLTVLSWRPAVGDSTSLRLLLLPFRDQLSALWKKKKKPQNHTNSHVSFALQRSSWWSKSQMEHRIGLFSDYEAFEDSLLQHGMRCSVSFPDWRHKAQLLLCMLALLYGPTTSYPISVVVWVIILSASIIFFSHSTL